MEPRNSKVPSSLRAGLAALAILTGVGGAYFADEAATNRMLRNEYIQAVAADEEVSDAVKIAMVMGSYYESSYRHIGRPYVDKLGKGEPLTVCNGITGPDVIASKYYTPAECYEIEKKRYIKYEKEAAKQLVYWSTYDPYLKATMLDFIHNKGIGNFSTSTLKRKANAGDAEGACMENPRWNRGTKAGVSTVLPGLVLRGESNAEICAQWGNYVFEATPEELALATPPPPPPAPPATPEPTAEQEETCNLWCRTKRWLLS